MPRIAIVSRDVSRFDAVAGALRREGLEPTPCLYDEAREAEVERELGACAAALVWVNPVQDRRTRARLDGLLRRAAARGLMVSAHPDVIDRMGVKAVLAATWELGWSGDAWFYATAADLTERFPARLAGGPRVLKQNRGNGGIGVWRVEAIGDGRVRVLEARDRTRAQVRPLAGFLAGRRAEIDRVGGFVDQAFQPRLAEGMIRCYLSGRRVAGFGWQRVKALLDPDGEPTPPRTYSGPDDPRFQALRRLMEERWAPALTQALGLERDQLPAIWDADFLFGPPEADGRDSFVLCEINVSSVSPMPEEAPAAIARTLAVRLGKVAAPREP